MYQAPAHLVHRFFSAPLSHDLKKKHNINAIPVKTGDTVRIMRGDRKGFEGKIIRVNRRKHRIYVEGVTREKVDGTSIPIPVHPSKVVVVTLNLDDKWRQESLNRKISNVIQPKTPAVEEEVITPKEPEKLKEQAKKKKRKKKTKTTSEAKKTQRRGKKSKKANSKGAE
jgi:large subunit ribosomal protein L24